MKATIELNEAEIKSAIEKALSNSYNVKTITLEHSGFPDSPDPRERQTSIKAIVEVECMGTI